MQSKFYGDYKTIQNNYKCQNPSKFLPDIHHTPSIKPIQNIIEVDKIPEMMLIKRSSLFDELLQPQTQRLDYRSIIRDKKISLHTDSNSKLVRFDQSQSSSTNSQPKSILKRKNSNSTNHSDVLDFFELIEETPTQIIQRNSKHIKLQTLSNNSPIDIQNTITPKRVSFNSRIQIKVIDKIESTPRILRRQYTDILN